MAKPATAWSGPLEERKALHRAYDAARYAALTPAEKAQRQAAHREREARRRAKAKPLTVPKVNRAFVGSTLAKAQRINREFNSAPMPKPASGSPAPAGGTKPTQGTAMLAGSRNDAYTAPRGSVPAEAAADLGRKWVAAHRVRDYVAVAPGWEAAELRRLAALPGLRG